MKEQKPIDDFFKDRLQDFSLDAPMHIWEKMADMPLQPEPKKDRKKWLWLLLLLPFLGIGSYLMLQQSGQPNITPPQHKDPTTINTSEEAIAQQLPAEEATPVAPNEQQEAPETIASTTSSSSDQTPNIVSTDVKSFVSVEKELSKKTSASIISEASSEEALEQSTNSFGFVKSTEAAQETVQEATSSQAAKSESEEQAVFQARLDLLMTELIASDIDLIPNPLGDEYMEAPVFKMKKPWETTVDIMSSMDFVMRQLEAKSSDFEDYARMRNNTETFRHGISVGMRLSTVSENGFAVRSGLNYSVINEQLNFKISEEERLTVTTRYGQDGSIIGQDTSLQLVGNYRIVNNRYTELDIPLLVGFERGGDKVSFSLNGGLLINMLSAQKGEFVSPNTEVPVTFSSNDPNSYRAFRNRLGLGFYGSMGFYFKWKDNMQVLFEPYVKYRPGSVAVDAYVLEQRYMTAGLFVGLRKRIQ